MMLANCRYFAQLKAKIMINRKFLFKECNYQTFSRLFYCQNYRANSSNIENKMEFDYKYLCDKANTDTIRDNIVKRKSNGDIDKVISLWNTLKHQNCNPLEKQNIEQQLFIESLKIPNKSSPHLYKYGETPHLLRTYNEKPNFDFKYHEFHNFAHGLHLLTFNEHLHNVAGLKTYVFNTSLANLERALIRYCIDFLLKKGITLISVPDLLQSHIIERCGMQTKEKRSQVYRLNNFENEDVCLSGTAEMAIGGFLQDRELDIKELPLKIAAVSRCYRKEVGGGIAAEKGIFRVHHFTKVEIFGVTANENGEESNEFFNELIKIQTDLFSALDIHIQVLDMPLCDLGDASYTKTDIEAWIPLQQIFGEISSASNCLDYQSRRLNLRYRNADGVLKFAHTLNATACAIPRVLISMVASNQTRKGTIIVPKVLQPFIGFEIVGKSKLPLLVNHFRHNSYTGSILEMTNIEQEVNCV